MASSSDDDFITVVCTSPHPIQLNTTTDREILISVSNILSWDLPAILCHQTVQVRAHRIRLIQHSSYFHGLLSGSFSESRLDCIAIEWNLETFLNVLNCVYGCPLDVTSNNFLPLFEGALYFGVEMLITKCTTWFSKVVVSSEVPQQIQLDNLISIWSFGLEHARDFLPELCASYLARNFMWAISMNCFVSIPYDLLQSCVKHMNLTVDSEMYLSDGLLVWLDANTERMEGLSRNEDDCPGILKEIRISLLPLWFAAAKRRSCQFSKFADESINSIFRLLKIPSTGSIDAFGDGHLHDLSIRLTKFSKKVNLSSCPQITSAMLLLSLLPSSHSMGSTLRSIKLERLDKDQCSALLKSLPTSSFEAVQEVDISKCPRLHLETAIECFCKSFPSLKTLKAAFLLNLKTNTLRQLVRKCPMICEVDLTVDTSPIISSQVSIVSSSPAITPQLSNLSLNVGDSHLYKTGFYKFGLSLAKLTLEGRSDLCDSDLQHISKFCVSLQYLNLKGCISLTDIGIATLLHECIKLHSVLVCDTSFGINSVSALCSSSSNYTAVQHIENKHLDSLALNLQTLHMGGCKCVDETSLLKLTSQMQKLKTLCLHDTHLSDGALYIFRGSSLEMLDVSNTKVSTAALAHLVSGNPGLKCLKARGCRNLSQQESDAQKGEFSSSYSSRELHNEIGRNCILEEIELGWGFSYSSFEALEPAITSLRKITVGLGGSLGEGALRKLPTICPLLESIILYFQVISDSIILNIMENLKNLLELALCHCLGDICILSFKFSMPNLRKLKLERVTPWMTNTDLVILTQSCANLVELSLLGCTLLNSESQLIISHGWPGLVSIHLEECGQVTTEGVSSLLGCKALEDLLLRHNGPGIGRSFIFEAASELPMLRKVSLDLCDASEGDFDIPDYADRYFLSTVKIARCKSEKYGLDVSFVEARRRSVHKETLVLVWNSKTVVRTVVKERL